MEHENLSTKLFVETCCSACACGSQKESAPIVQIDNMGRPITLED